MAKIKVLIVDDSALVRQFLNQILSEDNEIEVTGTAIDPIFALQKIMRDPPDVITLDVEMPRMDGLTFLEKIMKSYPTPTIMISAFTKKGCETTLKALELGAVDFINKPDRSNLENLKVLKREIINKVKNAAKINLRMPDKTLKKEEIELRPEADLNTGTTKYHGHKLIAIGASTGGVVAVRGVIEHLRPSNYSILIALHMPPGFTASFAERLGSNIGWKSHEGIDGQVVEPRTIYVAPGGRNMTLEKKNGKLYIRIRPCDLTDIYKPNVNKTFASVAKNAGPESIGIIMTGMGDDGAKGLLLMKQAGALTIAQSQETCMVFGMPRKAIEAGAVDYVLPLDKIPVKLQQLV